MCGTSSASTVSAKMSGLGESRHTNTATASRDVRFAPKADKRVDVSLSPLSADFVAEVAEEGGRLCLGAEHEP
jgi:hypothetical protein